ncbi:MAG TPA: hypothetical protein PKW95_03425 [bacterium]|nr:hypothetical protein [bacterium]
MITQWDDDYQRTKAIVKNGKKLSSPFAELANWISAKFQVNVLNIEYELVEPDDTPRLMVILETQDEQAKFQNGVHGNYLVIHQKAIAEQFGKLLREQGRHEFNLDRLFVAFSNFAEVARMEANSNIPDNEIKQLKKALSNDELWEISRSFHTVTFFFYTDEQVRKAERKGLRKTYAAKYYEILKRYDEFGYFTAENLLLFFDSKENFDNNYQSNWFYYYR